MSKEAVGISEKIKTFFISDPNLPTLFAGAGVSSRVGLPDWKNYVAYLAAICRKHGDRVAADLIEQRAEEQDYLGAAVIYKTCRRIPKGELLRAMIEPLEIDPNSKELTKLQSLLALPWSAIVTTNFDSAISKALTNAKKWYSPVELDDGSLKSASSRTDFFVARIHGRVDLPQTLAVDTNDYERLRNNSVYIDFLTHLLRSRSCLFVGFSFKDPAINFVTEHYKELCGPTYPSMHLAIVPDGATELAQRLGEINIDVASYRPSGEHAELWRSIRAAQKELEAQAAIEPSTLPSTTEGSFKQLMAFSYAQLQAASSKQPILRTVQEGLLLSLLENFGEAGATKDQLTDGVRSALALNTDEARGLVEKGLGRLIAVSFVIADGETIVSNTHERQSVLEQAVEDLARGVSDRILIREGLELDHKALAGVQEILEQVFLVRAWDLAAHYAGVAAGWGKDLPKVVAELATDVFKGDTTRGRAASEGVLDLLVRPENREADMLAAVGRAAFGIQLLLSSPRQAILQKHSLPDRIYLDSNILMPAITAGHPLRPVYEDLLMRLVEANREVGSDVEIIVGEEFLNEVVSHKGIAVRLVKELQLEEPAQLRRHILFRSAVDTNVFVGAYSGIVGRPSVRKDEDIISFSDFLSEVAPYSSEAELAKYISNLGIRTLRMYDTSTDFSTIFSKLRLGYERLLPSYETLKDAILVEHEAQQLVQLEKDAELGIRSLFVTADQKLMRVIRENPGLHHISGNIVSHIGLVGLVDVMVGLEVDKRSLARIMWSDPHTDDQQSLMNYFVRLGLDDYEQGLELNMHELASRVAADAAAEARTRNIPLFGNEVDVITRAAKFIDRYEQDFFRNWREAKEKHRKR